MTPRIGTCEYAAGIARRLLTQFTWCHHQNNLRCAILVGNVTVRYSVKCYFRQCSIYTHTYCPPTWWAWPQSPRVMCVQGVNSALSIFPRVHQSAHHFLLQGMWSYDLKYETYSFFCDTSYIFMTESRVLTGQFNIACQLLSLLTTDLRVIQLKLLFWKAITWR